MKSWEQWHEDYERPDSPLARRLVVVQAYLRTALDAFGAPPVVLSLCSGDGRDVIGVMAGGQGVIGRAVLVEKDPGLGERARRAAGDHRLANLEVRCQDAGTVTSFGDVIPVDVLLLCGVFGNIPRPTVKSVIGLIPELVRAGGYVIWTRGGSQPDRRPEIRSWMRSAGLEEIAFTGDPEPFGVGLNRLTDVVSTSGSLPETLFSFV